MKKTFYLYWLYLILIVLSLILVGCQHIEENETEILSDNQINDTSSIESENINGGQDSPKYQLYTPYLVSMSGPNRKHTDDLQWLSLTKKSYTEDVENDYITVEINGSKDKYEYLRTSVAVGFRSSPYRVYCASSSDKYVNVDCETGQITEVNFKISTDIDKDKTLPKLTQDECYAVALQYMEEFGFDIDSDEYVIEKSELKTVNEGKAYAHNIYVFTYRKYIDGIYTLDSCTASITEYGSLLAYRRNDYYDTQYIASVNIDYDRVEEIATEIAERVSNYIGPYEILAPNMVKYDKDTYAIEYPMIFYGDGLDHKYTDFLAIQIPIS